MGTAVVLLAPKRFGPLGFMSCQGRAPASGLTSATLKSPRLASLPHRESPHDGNASGSDFISIHRETRKSSLKKYPHYGTNTASNYKGQTGIVVVLVVEVEGLCQGNSVRIETQS